MAASRVTQAGIEVYGSSDAPSRVTAAGFEIAVDTDPETRITQLGFEILTPSAQPNIRVTFLGAEILWEDPDGLPDCAGAAKESLSPNYMAF